MKPRSKLEHAMLALAEKLPPITDRQRQWAFDNCFKPLAIVWPRKRQVRCLCCGGSAVYDKVYIDSFRRENLYDCPYCGRSMETKDAQYVNATDECDSKYFTVLTTFRGHQVARTWEVRRSNNRNTHYARYAADEIYQVWITDDGRECITGRQLHRSLNSTTWDFHKPLCIRKHNGGGSGCINWDDIYDITGNFLYPDVRMTPLLRRNGWRSDLLQYQNMIPMTEVWRALLTVPDVEMLVKTDQRDLLLHMVRRGLKNLPRRHAVCIANRHGYKVMDADMWLDYLQMADELGKDTHNPQVVCPADLRAAHDALLAPVARLRERREKERKAREALEWEGRYAREKAPYLGIAFGNGEISLHVLQSVAEFAEEGKAMHHCVFALGYYKKPESLILSARDSAGKRIETVEVNLNTMTVAQSRAVCNGNSPRHEEILRLVKDNMSLIRRAAAAAKAIEKSKNSKKSTKPKLCQRV